MKKKILFLLKYLFLPVTILLLVACQKNKNIQPTLADEPQFFSIEKETDGTEWLTIFTPEKQIAQKWALPISLSGKAFQRIGLYSTTYHPMIEALGAIDKVVAIDSIRYSNNKRLQEKIRLEEVVETGAFPSFDFEKLLQSQVEAIFIPPFSLTPTLIKKLESANIAFFYFNEWCESSPIARFRWIEVAGILLGKEKEAQQAIEQMKRDYQSQLNRKKSDDTKTITILVNYPWQNQWAIPKQESYFARLISDAGGLLIESQEGSGSLLLSKEEIWVRSQQAKIWLVNSDPHLTKKTIAKELPLFCEIAAWKENRIYNHSKRINPYGGNDFFETGFFHPDWVLNDLIEIIEATKEQRLVDENKLIFFESLYE